MLSFFKIALIIIYATAVTLRDLFESCQKLSNLNFGAGAVFETHASFNSGLDKVLCRICKSLIFATLMLQDFN